MHVIPLFPRIRIIKTLRTPQSESNLLIVNCLKGLSFLSHSDELMYTLKRFQARAVQEHIRFTSCPQLEWCSGKAICSVSVPAFMALCWSGGLGYDLFLEQLKTKFQLCSVLFVKPVVSYSQISAKGSEILKIWKKGKHVQRHSASQAPGHLAVSWTWIMVFCVTRNIWRSQLKRVLEKAYQRW